MADTLKRLESLVEKNVELMDRTEAIRQAERYEAELDRLIRRRDEATEEVSYGQRDIDIWTNKAVSLYLKAKKMPDEFRGEVNEAPVFNGKVEQFETFWTDCKLNFLDDELMCERRKVERLRKGVPSWFRPRLDGVDLKNAEKLLRDEFLSKRHVWPAIHALFERVPNKIGKDVVKLDQLARAVENAWRIVKSVPDGESLYKYEVFALTYNRLSNELCDAYRRQTNEQQDIKSLLKFIQEECTRWTAHEIDCGSFHRSKATQNGTQPNKGVTNCFQCGEPGHRKSACKNPPKCFKCNNSGHMAKDCPNNLRSSVSLDVSVLNDDEEECRPVCTVRVDRKTYPVVVDSGSRRTLFPKEVTGCDAPEKILRAVNGSEVYTHGPFQVHFKYNNRDCHWDKVYGHDKEFVILGADFLQKHQVTIQMGSGRVVFPDINLTDKESQLIHKVVEEFQDSTEGIGKTELIEHSIPTGDADPVAQRNRRIPVAFLREIDEHVEELFREELIEEISTSEWCSPINPIRKKDGSVRLTIDYRELNRCTLLDNWPMPRIDEILDKLANAVVFSRLDMRKGYYQIGLKEEDRNKTAFQWRGKLYQWRRMPMGLSGAPKTFQKLMQVVLGDLSYVECYLDDVIIHSTSIEAHIEHIREVLGRIKKAGLTLNNEKCLYGVEELDFLGFHVGHGEKRTSDEKAEIMRKYPTPQTKKAIRSFLGFANYLRPLIPNYAAIAKPLVDAMNEKKFCWSDECEASFKELRKMIIQKPSTYLPDLNKPFGLVTDASGTAMGAILTQQSDDGEWRVIEYMSKAFNDRERKLYSPIEAEAAAVVAALEKWRHYLEANEFQILSDHKPLKWLWTKRKVSNPRLQRWAQFLGTFPIKNFEHIDGEDNDMADTLSRLEIGVIDDEVRDPKLHRRARMNPSRYIQENGRLWLIEKGEKRLCVDSEDERRQILTEVHDKSGHLGRFKTEEVIRQRFYWPKWKEDVKKHLARCYKCAVAKDDIEPHRERLKPRSTTELWQRIHVDLCGPLTPSDEKTHIIVAQDAGSKWLEAKAVSSTTTSTITDWLSELWSRFGLPGEIVTDNGSNLDSKEFKEYCASKGIVHHAVTPYHHQSNGLVERGIQTIEKMVRTTCEEQREWARVLNDCIMAYNSRRHHTTGVSPAALMLGRELRLMIDTQFGTCPKQIDIEETQAVAAQTAEVAEQRSKRYYDRVFRPSNLSVGDRVLWHLHEQGRSKSKKLNQRWQGPFVVDAVDRPMAVLSDRQGKTKKLHVNHLKRFDGDAQLGEFRGRGRPRLRGRCDSE